MRIQHNIMAMSAYRNYTNNVSAMKKNLEKLSSGYKINRAGDDAAGLAISEKMRAQITGLETAQKNAKDGISLVQTAEGALQEVHDMLNRMVELATQSANGTYEDTTDRTQLQKEVDELLSEIDRIAESSNFNGIKLLDGTLGMNTDAFKVGDAVDAAEAVAAGSKTLTVTATHGGAGATAVPAELTVDLKALEVNITGKSTDKGSITINIAGVNLVVGSLAGTTVGGNAGTKTHAASAVANAIKNTYTGTSASKSLKIGDAYFKAASTSDGQITFEYVGYDKNGTFTADANGTEIGATAVNTLNGKLAGAKVSVTAGTKAAISSPDDIDHGITYTAAVAEKTGGLLGGEIELTASMVTGGAKLSIDGKDFTFKVTSTATSELTASGAVVIDSRVFKTEAEQLAEAKRLLTTGSTTNFDINTAAGNKISIDQKVNAQGKGMGTYTAMADVPVKVTTASQAAKGAGVKLSVTDGEIKDGNVLTIDGKKYMFNTKGAGTATDTTYIKVSDGIDGLKAALDAKYDVTKSGNELTIRTKVAAGEDPMDTKSPVILGKGLTLQIADTSAPYNQLNVAVQDCHTNSLGIKGLDISTEEAAQASIDKIRNAINYVSDVRGTLGATQNRLDHTINNLSVMTENIQDAESTIRDVDVAEEMMAYTKNNILIQSAQAMLAQANQVPQGVLQLLQ